MSLQAKTLIQLTDAFRHDFYIHEGNKRCRFGFSSLYLNALFLNDQESFYKRLSLIKDYQDNNNLDGLVEKIKNVKEALKKANAKPNEEELALLEVQAFFETLDIYEHPERHPPIFDYSSPSQSYIKSNALLFPETQGKAGKSLPQLLASSALSLTKKELKDYLDKLKEALIESKLKTGVLIRYRYDSVVLSFNKEKNQWELLDANALIEPGYVQTFKNSEEVAGALFKSFKEEGYFLVFGIEFIAEKKSEKLAEKLKKINNNQINFMKFCRQNKGTYKPIDMAAWFGYTHLFQELVAKENKEEFIKLLKRDNCYAFRTAAENKRTPIVNFLLQFPTTYRFATSQDNKGKYKNEVSQFKKTCVSELKSLISYYQKHPDEVLNVSRHNNKIVSEKNALLIATQHYAEAVPSLVKLLISASKAQQQAMLYALRGDYNAFYNIVFSGKDAKAIPIFPQLLDESIVVDSLKEAERNPSLIVPDVLLNLPNKTLLNLLSSNAVNLLTEPRNTPPYCLASLYEAREDAITHWAIDRIASKLPIIPFSIYAGVRLNGQTLNKKEQCKLIDKVLNGFEDLLSAFEKNPAGLSTQKIKIALRFLVSQYTKAKDKSAKLDIKAFINDFSFEITDKGSDAQCRALAESLKSNQELSKQLLKAAITSDEDKGSLISLFVEHQLFKGEVTDYMKVCISEGSIKTVNSWLQLNGYLALTKNKCRAALKQVNEILSTPLIPFSSPLQELGKIKHLDRQWQSVKEGVKARNQRLKKARLDRNQRIAGQDESAMNDIDTKDARTYLDSLVQKFGLSIKKGAQNVSDKVIKTEQEIRRTILSQIKELALQDKKTYKALLAIIDNKCQQLIEGDKSVLNEIRPLIAGSSIPAFVAWRCFDKGAKTAEWANLFTPPKKRYNVSLQQASVTIDLGIR